MRISTALAQKLGTDAMMLQQAKLTKTQMQVASGKKFLSPSDDVAATTNALDITQFVATTTQYQSNATQVQGRLEVEESSLASAVDIMGRLKELSVQGNNGALSATDRIAIGKEALELMDNMLGLANTLGPNGDYLFSGYQAQTAAFGKTLAVAGPPDVYTFPWQGNAVPPALPNEQRTVQVGATRFVADGDSGNYVFGSAPTMAGPTQDVFTTIQTFANNMLNNTPISTDIGDLDLAAQRIIEVRSSVGDRLNAVENQKSMNDAFNLQMKSVLSDIQDLDYTEAISRFNTQTQVLQAAQQAFAKVQNLSLFNFLR